MSPKNTMKTLSLWRSYVHPVKEAEEKVRARLPSMSEALERSFASLVDALSQTASTSSSSSSGVFLDPAADPREVCSELRYLCTLAQAFGRKIQELCGIRYPLDLKVMTTDLQNLEALRELWELLAVCRATVQEWECLLFTEFEVAEAQEKVALWKQRAASLVPTFPTHDAVLQEILRTLEPFSQHLPVLDKLCCPRLKEKHIKNIFKGMRRLYVPEKKPTVAELMSMPLREHLELINKVSAEGSVQWAMEQELWSLQRVWEAKLFHLSPSYRVLTWQQSGHDTIPAQPPSAATASGSSPPATQRSSDAMLIVGGLEDLRADAEDSVMALSSMLRSPYCSDFRPEVEHWARLLQQLEELLEMLERYQETWAFLTKMLNETCAGTQSAELLERFQAVDETFMEIIFSISSDHHVLNILRPKDNVSRHLYGHNLRMKLLGGLASMEAIATCLGKLLDRPRGVFPRLCFLSDQEVMKLCTSQPAPADLLAIVGKCFQGVRRLELHHDVPSVRADGSACQSADGFSVQMKVLAEFGSLVEHCCPSMSLHGIQQALSGALQVGAYLVLRSVNLLSQGVQASLGQHLADIHQFFSGFQTNTAQILKDEPNCPMSFAGKSIFARLNYGCVVISSKDYACDVSGNLREVTRHWPQFDQLARQVLLDSRYRIEVPGEEIIFEHFFSLTERPVGEPVLLVGEAASGRTSLCRALLSANGAHVSLPPSALLSHRDVRNILNNVDLHGTTTRGAGVVAAKQSGLLVFVDDLHEAPSGQ
ncbi:hypothetical protein CRUP_033325 [Coryphaenoides rupestris]|nr:hypothetical protein CRUP_033325 [Coryphaenoides rupestris]